MEIPGVNSKRRGISWGDHEKIVWNFDGFCFLALEIPGSVTQFCEISRGEALFFPKYSRTK